MKIAIYIRVSTHYQVDKDSLPLQREDLINYTNYVLNSSDYEVFEDAGYSAKNTDRPAFQNMMRKIRNQEFTHILVWKIDRISRNLLDFCDMYEELKKYEVTFISKNEQFDTSSAMGEAMLKIILVFAELERKLTGERVKAVMLDRASKGLWNGAPIPLGYKWDPKIKFAVPDENERIIIEKIFNTYLENESTSIVRNYLNSNNIQTKRNGRWTTKGISDIIRNPFYIGTYRYNYRESARGKKKKEEEWIILKDNHEPIVNKDLFNKCNAIMDRNSLRSNSKFRANGKTHILSGLIKCEACSGNYYSKQDKANLDGFRPSLYVCSNRYNRNNCDQKTISEKNIYDFLLQLINNISSSEHNINYEEFKEKLLFKLDAKDINCKDLFEHVVVNKYNFYSINKKINKTNKYKNDIKQKELEKYKRALARLEDLYLFSDEGIANKDYILKKKNLEDKIKEIQDELNEEIDIDYSEINNDLLVTIVDNILLKKIDIKKAIGLVGRENLKEYFNYLLKEIRILDKKITSVTFKNGLNIGFSY